MYICGNTKFLLNMRVAHNGSPPVHSHLIDGSHLNDSLVSTFDNAILFWGVSGCELVLNAILIAVLTEFYL